MKTLHHFLVLATAVVSLARCGGAGEIGLGADGELNGVDDAAIRRNKTDSTTTTSGGESITLDQASPKAGDTITFTVNTNRCTDAGCSRKLFAVLKCYVDIERVMQDPLESYRATDASNPAGLVWVSEMSSEIVGGKASFPLVTPYFQPAGFAPPYTCNGLTSYLWNGVHYPAETGYFTVTAP